ncbi:MAG: uracil-DNA glycosylase [Bacteroidota bacterium]|nr:uracil-DNA glycosylase [Bacteroidota bacterium]MDP4231846.1 uracil-DNA glycosylase [Bacteroidota bacterium]MDP4242732.1 uracil-DNA glycosylase [Bacteroidota bacterium]MDP4287183.1 uracil-DNA glycosylase [Bacteroidota bacterium]
MEQTLASDLERFVREQASRFGDVISYVPEQKIEFQMPKKPDVAVTEVTISGLDEKLAPHAQEPWYTATTLAELESQICNCQKCGLGATRTKFVFGVGDPNAKVMVIGEAPGADEDKQGEPFVGRAGQLLNKMLAAVQFERKDVYIANILKSRPPNNRDPKPEEVEACEPYLWKQIAIVKPRLILCLGRIAGTNLLKLNESLGKMRGQPYEFCGIPVIVTYHPAALLRNPDWKHGAWEDLKKLRRMYDELV